ncbi:MAG TPA: ATP-binding protein, partial [Acidobacteriaceae bacterium]|nr:ATP-binding protein [Acidobacteriaceae bacterium]
IFSNVIANAIDAMREGGVLSVSTHKVLNGSQDGIQIAIQDSGHGIEAAHLSRIFEPFFTTKGNLGTGIGLWVARELVDRRGGKISIASGTTPHHSGTTVTIFLPLAHPGRAAAGNG